MDSPYHTHCLYIQQHHSSTTHTVGVLEWVVGHKWTVHTTHTVYIDVCGCECDCMDSPFMSNNPIQALPKTSLWECLNGIVGHKWTVHTTHTVCIHPKTSLWECLNGTVGHKCCPYHTHCLYTPKNISVGVLDGTVGHKWTVQPPHF